MAESQLLSALVRIPLEQVEGGPNARGDVGDVGDLAQSIRALGMQKPLLVCDIGGGRYRVLDGHRRLAAARMLHLPHVDAVLRRDAGDAVRIQQQLAMHTHAKSFDPIAEAQALETLMFEHGMSREEIARTVGKSAAWVRDRIGLLQLAEDEQESIRRGTLSIASALQTLGVRRAQRDGRTGQWPGQPATKTSAEPKRHCGTCTCGEVSGA